MSTRGLRGALWAALALLFAARIDVWWWDDPSRVLGLPVGLTWHVAICVLATGVLWVLVRVAWPRGLDDEAGPPR